MRGIVWLILLFVVAVVAATALGHNDGLVTIAWGGWRAELSLNLAIGLLLAGGFALMGVVKALDLFLGLPRRAGEWRALQRERAAHAALREAFSAYFGARYSRAQRAARRALALYAETSGAMLGADHQLLAQLVLAGALHRLQDRGGRDAVLQAIEGSMSAYRLTPRGPQARAAHEGAQLLAAEWALDDQDAGRAQALLQMLPAGVARRTQALRLRLRAARLARQTREALELTRLLAKHQAFSASAASGLVRALALEHLDAARDAGQLKALWQQLENVDRRDTVVLGHAVRKAAAWGAAAEARSWIEPLWSDLGRLTAEDRGRVAMALASVSQGAGTEWLERAENAARQWPSEPAVALAAGQICAERRLWGKARQQLETAAAHAAMPATARRRAWRTLAQIARDEGDEPQAARCEHQASQIEDSQAML
ncbi:MAG: heme biosynthesis protein HemY [Rubrivivax sp.]|nr:heme biosynthesis protein HemY [Rubrivivax sp.]